MQVEGRIEGDQYYALWIRNDLPWGNAIHVEVFNINEEIIGNVKFVCHPEFSNYERLQNMSTAELLRIVEERLKVAMKDGLYTDGWSHGLQIGVVLNTSEDY
jgi:hypothetical protein